MDSRQIIAEIIDWYEPTDIKFRRFPLYKYISKKVYAAYKASNLFINKTESQNKDRNLYFENYSTIQVKPNTILFDSFWGRKIACNPYAVFKEMYTRTEFSHFTFTWVKNNNVLPPTWMEGKDNINYVAYRSSEYVHTLLSSEYVVGNSNFTGYFIRKPEQKYINLWHGIPLKKMGVDILQPLKNSFNTQRNFTQSTHIFLSSEYAIRKTVLSYGDNFASKRAHIIGSPRVDLTFNSDPNEVRDKLDIRENKKIILYAPTWRGAVNKVSSEIHRQIDLIQMLSSDFGEEYEILLSIHNYTKHNLKSIPQNCNIIPDDIQINEVLAATDVLISDYSSIFFDFLPLDRPIILYAYDLHDYKVTRGLYLDIEDLPVNIAYTKEQLKNALRSPSKPSELPNYNKTIRDILPMEDGKASQRIVDMIINNDVSQPIYKDCDKTTLLFYAGAFLNNGITHSFLNLVASIDHNKYDVSVIVDCGAIDKSEVSRNLFEMIPPNCRKILKSEATFIHNQDKQEYQQCLKGIIKEPPNDSIKGSLELEQRRLFSDTKFDVVIDFSGYSAWWAHMLTLVNADKRIIYQHNDLFAEATSTHAQRNQEQLFQVFNTYQNYDAIASVSPSLKTINDKKLSAYYPADVETVFARNVINLSKIKNKASIVFDLPKSFLDLISYENQFIQFGYMKSPSLKFVTSGRLSPEKNHERLIRAFKIVVDNGINASLIIIGGGVLQKELIKLVKKLGLTGRVVITGQIDNPFPLLNQADCFVLSSDYEGQPMVLLEALALNKFCIGTNIPSIEYVIKEVGQTVDPTPQAFAEAMSEFAKEPVTHVDYDLDKYTNEAMNDFYRLL